MATRITSVYSTYDKNLPPALAQALQRPYHSSEVNSSALVSSPPAMSNLVNTRASMDYGTTTSTLQIQSPIVVGQKVPARTSTLQERLHKVFQMFVRQPGLSSQFVSSVTREFRDICQAFSENEQKIRSEYEPLSSDRENLFTQLKENQSLLENPTAKLDRACHETIDRFEPHRECQRSLGRLKEGEQKLKHLIYELQEKIRIQDEQISGKRALWLDNHPSSEARRLSQRHQDPYNTPSSNEIHNHGLRITSGYVSSARNLRAQFEQIQSNTRISNDLGFDEKLLSGLSNPNPMPLNVRVNIRNTPGSKVDHGDNDTLPEDFKLAIVPFKSEDQAAEEFIDDIAKCWKLVEAWARAYADIPNDLIVDQRISKNKYSWREMLSLTYTDFQDAQEHVVSLIRDETTRRWFVMRMAVHYICKHVWDFSAWKGHDALSTEKIDGASNRLKVKGLTSKERSDAVALQTSAVQAIVGGRDFLTYRAHRLSQHTKQLREWVGPMLNSTVKRGDAGKDIGAIIVHAFDLSVRMHTSGWSFQLMFPDCGSKFGSTSMVCRDELITETPLDLQIRQVRLKLVITPVVTIRDDRGVSIRVKQLHCANVLIVA